MKIIQLLEQRPLSVLNDRIYDPTSYRLGFEKSVKLLEQSEKTKALAKLSSKTL
ncbi:MAG: hypothetical protein ACXIUQ_10420 [Cecembia sp.]